MIRTILLMAFVSPVAMADGAKPVVVDAKVSITKASNPNGECGASEYGAILEGTYTDAKGAEQTVHGCVESVVIPLDAPECLVPKKVTDEFRGTMQTIWNAARVKNVTASLLVDADGGGFTVLSLDSDCK